MKKTVLIIAIFIVTVLGAQAQEVKSIGAGADFLSATRLRVSGSKKEGVIYELHYKPMFGGFAFYEAISHGVTHMLEASFLTGNLSEIKESDSYYIEGWDHFSNLKTITLNYYVGNTFFPGKRFQLPIYAGIGANYIMADPIKSLALNVGLKARAKFYITDRFGIFAGAGCRYGLGSVRYGSNGKASLGERILNVEAGLTFSL